MNCDGVVCHIAVAYIENIFLLDTQFEILFYFKLKLKLLDFSSLFPMI